MSNRYDVIVVGVGSMGASACWHLARRGVRVLGFEQFDIPNTRASHHGFSRMIRLAYFEHPDYVALLRRAYEVWDDLERDAGQQVLHVNGGLYVGRPDSELVTGSIEAARAYDLPHEVLDRADVARRFPQFHVPDDSIAFYETKAGFVVPERAVASFAEQALRHGATLRAHEPVESWSASDSGVCVRTAKGTYEADRLVIAGGAWSNQLLHDLKVSLTVTRQTLAWVWPKRPDLFAMGTFPCWALDLSPRDAFRGVHYGFPMAPPDLANPGFKLALHWPDEPCDPDTVDRDVQPGDEEQVRVALKAHFPGADGDLLAIRVCLYTNTPDGHFVIDRHPEHDNVTIACGFSGHGFKFASVVGEALADLGQRGETDLPIGFLSAGRFAKTS